MRLGDEGYIVPVETISTGSLSLDIALGVGGVPRGRIVEIYGPEGSGKTTLTCSIIAQAQKSGGMAAFVDAEHAFDVTYGKKIGIDIENLLVSQPDTGEQALEIAEVLVRSGALDIVVIDSVAALVPAAELNGEMGDAHVGLQARLMSQALRKLTGRGFEDEDVSRFHEPDPDEDRRPVRQPRDDIRRKRAQVLRDGEDGHPPYRRDQGGGGSDGKPDQGEGREEQGRPAVQNGRVRYSLRRGDQLRVGSYRHRLERRDHQEERYLVFLRR